jgi:hypothetical protein
MNKLSNYTNQRGISQKLSGQRFGKLLKHREKKWEEKS